MAGAGKLRFPRTSQPQVAVPIDRGHPIGAKVRNFYTVNSFVNSRDAGVIATSRGLAFNTAGSSRVAVGAGRSDGRFTVMVGFVVSDGVDPDAAGEYIFACSYDGATEPFVFRLNASRQLYTGSFSGGSVTHATSLTLDSYAVGYALVGAATVSEAWTAGHIVNGVDTSTSGTFAGVTRKLFTTNIGSADITGTISRYYSKPIHWVIEFDGHLTASERAAVAANPWQLFAPIEKTIWVPVSAGGLSLALTGSAATSSAGTNLVGVALALAGSVGTSSAGTLAPSASVALAGAAATSSAGTLAPSVTIALTGTQAAASAGTLTYSAADVTVALSGQSATSAAGTLVNSASIALAGFLAAATAGTLTASGGTEVVGTTTTGAGRPSRKRTRNHVVEIDGEDYIVGSVAEAHALLDKVQEEAEQVAKVAVERAAKATTKPIRKILHDARKALQVPQITAPKALDALTKSALTSVESLYASTMRDIEIAALFKRAQAQEDDDEDVLMLMAL